MSFILKFYCEYSTDICCDCGFDCSSLSFDSVDTAFKVVLYPLAILSIFFLFSDDFLLLDKSLSISSVFVLFSRVFDLDRGASACLRGLALVFLLSFLLFIG